MFHVKFIQNRIYITWKLFAIECLHKIIPISKKQTKYYVQNLFTPLFQDFPRWWSLLLSTGRTHIIHDMGYVLLQSCVNFTYKPLSYSSPCAINSRIHCSCFTREQTHLLLLISIRPNINFINNMYHAIYYCCNFHVIRNTIFYTKNSKFLFNKILFKYAKFLASETCDNSILHAKEFEISSL